ncbi:MAG TPA: hypothetical protein VJH37_04570 [Candidatus Nanoarchaeia archaeon]|nr:hypothetical protein [Candidatus Nanoarchaeia archaeon]
MRKEIILSLLILTLVTAACSSPSTPTPACKPPFKALGSVCCLDNNNNDICDDSEKKLEQDACTIETDCELNECLGCVNGEWARANPMPDCIRFPPDQYECECVQSKCSEVKKVEETKITAGNRIRFSEEKLPLSLEMQKDTRILFVTEEGDEVYTLSELQESQITIFYGKDRFIIKKGTNQIIGPLEFIYNGVNPPKSGNFAMIKIDKPAA